MILLEDLGAGDVAGHHVGGELDPLEVHRERLGQRAHEQRLREAGHTDEQDVAAGAHGNEDLVDQVFLADDDLAKFAEHAFAGIAGMIDGILGIGSIHGEQSEG